MKAQFKYLPIDSLCRGTYQPRQTFDDTALQELAQSIEAQGLIEPLVVRPLSDHHYEIIAGERRWRACMLIGLHDLPCLINTYSDEQAAAVTLIENVQRQDLNLIEEARGYQRLIHEFRFNQEDVAVMVGKSRSHIANILRLLTLSDHVQHHIKTNALSLGHARMLVGLSIHIQDNLANQTIQNTWSVRKLEDVVRTYKTQTESSLPSAEYERQRLESSLAEQMGAPVQITTETGKSGWLKIKFYDNDTLSGLLDRMGLRYDE